jgi:hypothetical protein
LKQSQYLDLFPTPDPKHFMQSSKDGQQGSIVMPLVRVASFFEAEYLLRCGRKPQVGFFEREFALPVQEVGRDSVETAFRFRDSRFGAVEILQWDDKLWWPMYFDGSQQAATLAQLQAKLEDREYDLLGLGTSAPFERATTRFDHLPVREVLRNTTEAVLNRAFGKLQDNVLICAENAYARGGVPLYLPPVGPSSTPWLPGPSFVNSGAGRSIDPDECLRWEPGDLQDEAVQARLRKRAFVSARRTGDAFGGDLPLRIEILPAARDDLDCSEVHIDACMRDLRKLVASPAWAVAAMSLSSGGRHAERRSLGRLQDELVSAAKSRDRPNRFATTLARADAIEAFVRFVDGHDLDFHRGDLVEDCRQALGAFDRAECDARAQAFSALSAEDDQALALLGTQA